MAEFGLFIGWGSPRTGREKAAAQAFQDMVAYWQGLPASGEIEGVELALLAPHGGDLSGFALLRGEQEKLMQVRVQPEFLRLELRLFSGSW